MPATYEPIATTTLTGTAATITINSIPSTYTDLRLIVSILGTAGFSTNLTFNNDATALYSRTLLYGNGTSASTTRESTRNGIELNLASASSTIPYFYAIDIFSYAGSTNKTVLITGNEDANGSGYILDTVGLYRSTTAISRLDLKTTSSTFAIGTTATLYGILKA